MRILIDNIVLNRAQFEEIHGKGYFLGSSEIAAAAGLNRFQTPLQLWLRKTGRDVAEVDNIHTKLGRKMESVVAELFSEATPQWRIEKCNTTYQHQTLDWATCTPDYMLSLPISHAHESLLEIKTSGIWANQEWQDGNTPEYALCQTHWQLGIMELASGYIAALIGGKEYYQREVKYSKDVFSQLVEIGEKFIALVKSDTPPEATWKDDVASIWKPTEKSIELPTYVDLAQSYVKLDVERLAKAKELEGITQKQEAIKQNILLGMQDANRAVMGSLIATRKSTFIKEAKPREYTRNSFSIKGEK